MTSHLEALRQAEIEHFDGPVGPQLDVGRFEIAMDDALLVGRFERLGDLPGGPSLQRRESVLVAMRSASVGPSTSSSTSA